MGNNMGDMNMSNDDCAMERKRFKTFLLFSVVASIAMLSIAVLLRILFSLGDESIVLWLTVPYWLSAVTISLGLVLVYSLKPYTLKGDDQYRNKKGYTAESATPSIINEQNIQRLQMAKAIFISDMIFVGVQGITLMGIFLYRAITLGAYHGGNVNDHYEPDHSWRFGNCLSDQQSCTVTEVILTITDGLQFTINLSLMIWGLIFYIKRRGFQINCKLSVAVPKQAPTPAVQQYQDSLEDEAFTSAAKFASSKFSNTVIPTVVVENPHDIETAKALAFAKEPEQELRVRNPRDLENSIQLSSGLILRQNIKD